MKHQVLQAALLASAAISLSACGGGGGVNSTPFVPTPTPTPPPTPTPTPVCPPDCAVTIFKQPAIGEFASVGASADGANGYVGSKSSLGTISAAASDQPLIRYNSDGTYDVRIPGKDWSQLIPYGNGTGPEVFTSVSERQGFQMVIAKASDLGYSYSELASWQSNSADRFGDFAFGVLTPAGGVPVSGTASYAGIVQGQTDVFGADFWGPYRVPVSGTVDLDFDFAQGSLMGAITLNLDDFGGGHVSLGSFNFKDTVFSVGSTTYSGKFDTTASGQNFFLGSFTGPSAQETIGAWALPFIFNNGTTGLPADNKTHQAFGAWIAKKGP
jgi:hypothetical protein